MRATLWHRIACLGVAVVLGLGVCAISYAGTPTAHHHTTASQPIVPASYDPARSDIAGDPGEDPALEKSCGMAFLPVKPQEGVGSIIGTVSAQCDVPPQSHVMTVSLELRPRGGGDWVTIASAPPDERIPPGPPFRTSYQVTTPCQPGLWRVAAEAHGVGPTGIPFRFTDYSLPAFIQCSRGK